jgi:hypothetical protein
MNAYSDGWQLPVADDVTDGELIAARWDVERGTDAATIAVAANDVRRPLHGRTVDPATGAWAIDPSTGALTLVRAPDVRYSAEQGRPGGWSEQGPETSSVVLARSRSRVTRSRKGRSSFVVTQRSTHITTTGDREASGADWTVPPGNWTGATLAQLADAFVRAHAFQSGTDLEPLPRLIGADDGRQMVKPIRVDLSGAVDVEPSDVPVPADGLARIGRGEVGELTPYLLRTNDGDIHAVSWQNTTLAGIDDGADWMGHAGDGIADAHRSRQLARRIPRRIVDQTHVLADVETDKGRRLIRGTVADDGTQSLVAPGIGGWWIGHRFVADAGSQQNRGGRTGKAARSAVVADVRATVDGWLPVAVALGIGQVAEVDGATLARPTVERFTVTINGATHGGRTASAAIVKARRALLRT